MMKNFVKLAVAAAVPMLFVTAPTQAADFFTGYAVEVLSGANSTNPTYDSTLVGFSTTATGPVSLYRFTSDRTYAEMLANNRVHQQRIRVSYVGGTITGVYYEHP